MLNFFKRKVDPKTELKKVLSDASLPSFPTAVMNALEKVRSADASSQEVAKAVSVDPGITAKLLGAVNSASYAMRHRIRSIDHAVSILGRNELESMLLSMGTRDVLPRNSVPGYDASRFWVTAARRATTARSLAERIAPRTCSESFTASLLQDMAVPLLAIRREDYGPVLEQWHRGSEDLAKLERETFDWDHAEVATWMCAEWKFPDELTDAIAAHHGTTDGDPAGLAAVNLVAPLREVDEEIGIERLVETAHDSYGLSKDETKQLVEESFESAREISQLFS